MASSTKTLWWLILAAVCVALAVLAIRSSTGVELHRRAESDASRARVSEVEPLPPPDEFEEAPAALAVEQGGTAARSAIPEYGA